jgi:hypothetical protein
LPQRLLLPSLPRPWAPPLPAPANEPSPYPPAKNRKTMNTRTL